MKTAATTTPSVILFSISQMILKVLSKLVCQNKLYSAMTDGISHSVYYIVEYIAKFIADIKRNKTSPSFNLDDYISHVKDQEEIENIGSDVI